MFNIITSIWIAKQGCYNNWIWLEKSLEQEQGQGHNQSVLVS